MVTASYKRFIEQIRATLAESGLTQAELARRVGMQPTHLNAFLKGRNDILAQRLTEILLELGLDLSDSLKKHRRARLPKNRRDDPRTLVAKLARMSPSDVESISVLINRLGDEERVKSRRRRVSP